MRDLEVKGIFRNEQECGLRDHWGWGFDGIQGLGLIIGPKPRSRTLNPSARMCTP